MIDQQRTPPAPPLTADLRAEVVRVLEECAADLASYCPRSSSIDRARALLARLAQEPAPAAAECPAGWRALKDIAKQHLHEEMDEDELENGDIEGAYDEMIRVAREAIALAAAPAPQAAGEAQRCTQCDTVLVILCPKCDQGKVVGGPKPVPYQHIVIEDDPTSPPPEQPAKEVKCRCSTCAGTGEVPHDPSGDPIKCAACNGTGRRPAKEVAEERRLSWDDLRPGESEAGCILRVAGDPTKGVSAMARTDCTEQPAKVIGHCNGGYYRTYETTCVCGAIGSEPCRAAVHGAGRPEQPAMRGGVFLDPAAHEAAAQYYGTGRLPPEPAAPAPEEMVERVARAMLASARPAAAPDKIVPRGGSGMQPVWRDYEDFARAALAAAKPGWEATTIERCIKEVRALGNDPAYTSRITDILVVAIGDRLRALLPGQTGGER